MLTDKLGLRFSIGLGYMPAMATGAGCVSGVYKSHRNACNLSLISNKSPEFSKRPFSKPLSLLFSNRYPEAVKLFNSNGSLGVFGSLNDLFGYHVVNISLEPSLSARKVLKMPLGGFRTMFLQSSFNFSHALSNSIDLLPGKGYAIRCGGKVHNAHVYANISSWNNGRILRGVYHKAKAKLAMLIDKVRLPLNLILFKVSMFAKNHGNFASAVNGKYRNGFKVLERQYTLVVNNGGLLLECVKPLSVDLVGFGDFAYSPYGKLGGKTEFLPCVSVAGVVEFESVKLPFFKGCQGDVVAGAIKGIHGFKEGFLLPRIRQKFNLKGKFHAFKYSTLVNMCKLSINYIRKEEF